jgi:predicted PurR-regulated permease PerM
MKPADASFVHRTLLVVGIVAVFVIVMLTVIFAADVFLVIFGGVLLAIFVRGLSDPLHRRTGLSERASVAIVISVLAVLLAAAVWFLAGEISGQLDQLGQEVSQTWGQLREQLGRLPWGRQLLALSQQHLAQDGDAAARLAQAFSSSLGALASLIVIAFIGLYLAVDPQWYRRGLLQIIPPRHRAHAAHILSSIGSTLRWWLIGRVIGMVVVGLAIGIGLWLLGMPLALALGAIAFLLDFIPFIGPLLAAVPALLLAFAVSPTQAVSVALLYGGVQLVEGYVLTPLIEQRSVRLPPALTIAAQVLLGVVTGALGVLFATPLTAAAVTLIQKLYVEDALGDTKVSSRPAGIRVPRGR